MTLLEKLSAPFPPATVLWRIGATTQDKSKGMALAYIDARDVQDRLNEVCGHEWQVKHHYCGGQMLACEIGIKVDGEWLWRGDGAGAIEPNEESRRLEEEQDMARKAAFSDSFKRAAVRWGIGRYLYDIDSPWVDIEKRGNSYVFPDRVKANLRSTLMNKTQSNVEAPTRPAEASARPTANKQKHPKWDHAAARFREIERAIKGATSPKMASDIWAVNQYDLDIIEDVGLPYAQLEALRDRMLAKLTQTPADAGSAPALMGEP